MSAECNRCGSDITYPPGTWPVGECALCKAWDERDAALSAVARLREAVEKACGDLEDETFVMLASELYAGAHPLADAVVEVKEQLRAALVDEPAATLAEPDQAEAQGEAAASRSGQGSPDGNAQGSGSASAAADEPRCAGCGWRVADCNCVAAADEPAHKRPASSDGMGRTPQGGRATQDPEIGASSPAAADEPGETP